MSLLSPAGTYHAELREQLSGVGRALALQRALRWCARGLVAGTAIVLIAIVWAWTREGVASLSIPLLVSVPIIVGALFGAATLFLRYATHDLARSVDRAARLQERSTTALELGARGDEFPLALAQMRDAVEHLKRVDLLEAFPLAVPKKELMATFFVVVIAALIAIAPNPWLLRARASNPAITVAREQAQRVERLADSIPVDQSAELDPLRELLRKGARTIDARSNEPNEALTALQDLEEQVRQMGAGDDQLAAALAAVASALAADPATQPLASAINTGDLREISRAAKDLAAQTDQLSGQDKQRVAKVLSDAAGRAGRASPSVSGDLSDAANALQAGSDGQSDSSAGSQTGQMTAGAQAGASAANGRSARDALNQLSSDAAAAAERQRAESQLESSRNALERALGRTQSRSASSGRPSTSANGQRNNGSQSGSDPTQGGGQGQPGDPGADSSGDQTGAAGAPGSDNGSTGDSGQGGGYSTGGTPQNRTGPSTTIDTISRAEQVPSGSTFNPDQSMQNPYLGQPGDSSAHAIDEPVSPQFSGKPTQGNSSGTIPLGLRDLVKDYFSSLDQK